MNFILLPHYIYLGQSLADKWKAIQCLLPLWDAGREKTNYNEN